MTLIEAPTIRVERTWTAQQPSPGDLHIMRQLAAKIALLDIPLVR